MVIGNQGPCSCREDKSCTHIRVTRLYMRCSLRAYGTRHQEGDAKSTQILRQGPCRCCGTEYEKAPDPH
jgi:hypothetical protein